MRPALNLLALLAIALSQPSAAAPPANDLPPARTPEESLRSIRVRPGFTVELVASEPLVTDPIAFDWSADGRLWVIEMGDYPLGIDGKGTVAWQLADTSLPQLPLPPTPFSIISIRPRPPILMRSSPPISRQLPTVKAKPMA